VEELRGAILGEAGLLQALAMLACSEDERVQVNAHILLISWCRSYVLNTYSRIPVTQPQEYEYRIPPG